MSDLISRADAIDALYAYQDAVRIIKALPSADAVTIHEDGTLEVKVPNAQKVGRVLVVDTDSHIGGGLFYPADAENETCDSCKYFKTSYEEYPCADCTFGNSYYESTER